MSQIFSIIQALSGQKNSIVIPAPYLDYFSGDQQAHALGAILNQLVFWSGKSELSGGWFYKEHRELAEEIRGVSEDQAQRLVNKLCKRWLPGIIETKVSKVNGTPKTHYRIDGDALISKLFPSTLDSAESRNGNREVAESFPYTDQYIQINKTYVPSVDGTPISKTYSDEFEKAWSIYPKREGSNPKKDAYRSWNARLKEGVTSEEMLQGVIAYAEFCKEKKQLNTAYVMQAKRFFGSENEFQSDWKVSPISAKQVVNTQERDEAYRRFTTGVGEITNPSQLEIAVRRAASRVGIKGLNASFAIHRWNSLWSECSERLSGNKSGEVAA
ncbi:MULTISPECIES: hypothetical protein [Limnobaculum]|uniref:hypothetical protein n=1 Tax=Limnobaculum TaxID=2172100 RepID=UPI001E381933|nr:MULTISPECIES: hypothetical protein [Limnobaculum]